LANDPPLLVADDYRQSRPPPAPAVIDLSASAAGGRDPVVTHDVDLAKRAGRILTVAEGRIACSAAAGEGSDG
jgi:putative ABC transport system ATP-binding protein